MNLRKIVLYTTGILSLTCIGILLVLVSLFYLDNLTPVLGFKIDRGIFAIAAGILILYLAKMVDGYIKKNLEDSHRG